MALEWLQSVLGEAHTPEVAAALEKEIGKHFVARRDFNDLNAKYKDAAQSVTELETTKTARDQAQEQLTKLQGEQTGLKKTYAVDLALAKAGVVNTKAVKAVLDLDKVSVDDAGTLKGLSEQLDGLKKSDPWAFSSASASTQLPLGGTQANGGGTPTGNPDNTINALLRGRRQQDG